VTGQSIPTRGALRVLRGGLLAGTSSALAVTAHAVAGGMLPDTGLALLLTLAVGAAGTALASRRATPLAILVTLGASHLGIHLVLSAAAAGSAPAMHPVNDWVMAGGHLVAVLGAALMLTRAEAAVFTLAAIWAMLLPNWLAEPPAWSPSPRATLPWPHPARDTALAVLLRRACARRGPPGRPLTALPTR
jgi:hypothetical protein